MEKSLEGKGQEEQSMLQLIKEKFACGEVDVRSYSPLTLAYIGDSIYDLIIRTVIVERGNRAADKLHKTATKYVNATTQSAMVSGVLDILSEEEKAVYQRGRNAKSYSVAKNASHTDYRKATGFEALIGYLYLQDKMERIIEIIQAGISTVELEI